VTSFKSRAVYEIWWKNIVERGRTRVDIWRMRIACWIPKATDTHTGCVILIDFPVQQWFYERPSMVRYTYSVCVVFSLQNQCDRNSQHPPTSTPWISCGMLRKRIWVVEGFGCFPFIERSEWFLFVGWSSEMEKPLRTNTRKARDKSVCNVFRIRDTR
jgi:hypothetical protein